MASKAIDFAPSKYAPKYSPELVAEMLLRISEGQTVVGMWREDRDKFPHPVTWDDWCGNDAALALAGARAKKHAAEHHITLAEEIISTKPELALTKDGSRWDSASVTWLKNRTDFHLKRAAQIDPAQYGDKQLHAGHDGGSIKTETVAALPSIMERLRSVRKAGGTAAEAIIDQPAVAHADPSPKGHDGPKPLEPGDPGMEFV